MSRCCLTDSTLSARAKSNVLACRRYLLPHYAEQSRLRMLMLLRLSIRHSCLTLKGLLVPISWPPAASLGWPSSLRCVENLPACNLVEEIEADIPITQMPLGRGILTSTFAKGEAVGDSQDRRSTTFPRLQEANKAKNLKIVNQFKALADKKGCSISQLAIAWVLKQGDDIIPIPGTKRLKYLEENWRSLDVHLSDEEEAEIRHFVVTAELAGGNMPVGMEHFAFRDTAEES